jgi:hypothetical protein
MTSPNLQHSQRDAADALHDQLELDLLALTTATLEDGDAAPCRCVDEFATEFLIQCSMRPGNL